MRNLTRISSEARGKKEARLFERGPRLERAEGAREEDHEEEEGEEARAQEAAGSLAAGHPRPHAGCPLRFS